MPKLNLHPPLINACGVLSYLDIFERLEKMGARFGAWLPKSIGPFSNNPKLREKYGWGEEKQGNDNPTIYDTGHVLLNSFALPTPPIESWIEEFEKADIKKPIIGSVYGNKSEDYALLVSKVDKYVSGWELNVSCPNIEPGEEISLMESMAERERVKEVVIPVREATEKPVTVKLSPNENYIAMSEAAAEYVDYIGCGNTLGPGLVIDIYSRKPILAGVYGGMSGAAIKPRTMKMVNNVFEVLKGTGIGIVAYGGIEKWEDIIEYAIAGAEIFGVGTALINKTSEEIVRFSNELWDGVEKHLRERGTTLDKLIGSLEK